MNMIVESDDSSRMEVAPAQQSETMMASSQGKSLNGFPTESDQLEMDGGNQMDGPWMADGHPTGMVPTAESRDSNGGGGENGETTTPPPEDRERREGDGGVESNVPDEDLGFLQFSAGGSLEDIAASAPSPLEPKRLSDYAIKDDLVGSVGRRLLATVPVRKPSKEAFVRTKGVAGQNPFMLLDLNETTGKVYLLLPDVAASLQMGGETTVYKALLVPSVDRHGNFFLWPLKLSDMGNSWNVSGLRAAAEAENHWVRVQSNRPAKRYDVLVAEQCEAEPTWPEEDFETILKIAFRGLVVKSLDHPVFKELRGDF